MIKLVYILMVSCIFSISLFSQSDKTEFKGGQAIQFLDSVNTVSGINFKIKDKLSDWSDNFADITYSINIFRQITNNGFSINFKDRVGGYSIKENITEYSNSSIVKLSAEVNKGTNPGDYEVETRATITGPGTYYFVGTINGRSEHGSYFEEAGYWIVTCLPKAENTLVTNLVLKNEYHFGEKLSFNFSIPGNNMDLLSAYHYKVFQQGNEIFAGSGSFVNLDFITDNPKLVNKSFSIVGYYGGKLIHFFNPNIPGPDSTIWQFKLLPPEKFKVQTKWMSLDDFNLLNQTDFIDALDSKEPENRKFKFTYFTAFENSGIVTLPEINDLEIYTEPSGFLINDGGKYSIYKEDLSRVIELKINPVFISSIAKNETRKVILHMKFRTQFGEEKKFDFVGYIF